MTLGDDVMRVLPDFRLAAQSLMVDTGTIVRPGAGPGTLDPDGDWNPATSATIYAGPCRVRKPSTAQEQEMVFGDVNVAVSRYVVNLPHDAPLVAVDDVFTLTASGDLEILNVPMRVAVVTGKSILMYRQLGLEVIE